MQTRELVLNCSLFKEAALLKVPDQILKPVENWALSLYCRRLKRALQNLLEKNSFDRDVIKSIKYIIILCNANIKPQYSTTKFFSFPISYFPYIKQFYANYLKIENIEFVAEFYDPDISEAPPTETDWSGLWQSAIDYEEQSVYLGKMFIKQNVVKDATSLIFNSKISDLTIIISNILSEIKITVRHELQHMIQAFIQQAVKSNRLGGLPGKKMLESGFDPLGVSTSKQMSGRLTHSLQDAEFYTNLNDNIDAYKQTITKVPLNLQKSFLLSWIAQLPIPKDWTFADIKNILQQSKADVNIAQIAMFHKALYALRNWRQFFQQLKQLNYEKYKKAVKEFYKIVGR